MAVNPDPPSTAVGSVLTKLRILDDGVDFASIDAATVRNGIRYRTMGSDVFGLMFTAGDATGK
ncbi:hypothetical protein [Paenibacillus sp. GCM10012306]|uniref:hypothetical protein n=1 Tax=Paenibacillus sp. GCM10012306 TaxID=3317342 RepID=UPI00360BA6D7